MASQAKSKRIPDRSLLLINFKTIITGFLFVLLVLNYHRYILLKESSMVMNFGGHVYILKATRFEQVIPDPAFRDEVLRASIARDMTREFDVKIETVAGVMLQSTFTAASLVQLTNQEWLKSITKDSVARLG